MYLLSHAVPQVGRSVFAAIEASLCESMSMVLPTVVMRSIWSSMILRV